MKYKFKLLIISFCCLFLTNCNTYTVKPDISKKGELTKTPKWYIKYNWFKDYKSALRFNQWMFSTASLIEHLIIEKIIKIDSIIENIPILKKKYKNCNFCRLWE